MVDEDGERKVPVRLFEKLSIVPDNDAFAPAQKVMIDLSEKVSKILTHWVVFPAPILDIRETIL